MVSGLVNPRLSAGSVYKSWRTVLENKQHRPSWMPLQPTRVPLQLLPLVRTLSATLTPLALRAATKVKMMGSCNLRGRLIVWIVVVVVLLIG